MFPLALRLGWLNEVGVAAENPREKVYGFYHATFQEYFAALAVPDWDYFLPEYHVDRPVEGKRYRIFEPQWKQVILLWLGRWDVKHEEKEGFIQALVEFDDGCGDWSPIPGIDKSFYGFQAYFLAATCSSEFKSDVFKEIIDLVLNWSFGSYYTENQDSCYSFWDIISESATNALINANKKLLILDLIYRREYYLSSQLEISLFFEKLGILDREYLEKIEKILEQKSVDKDTKSTIIGRLEKVGDRQSINCLIDQLSLTTDDLRKRLIAESILGIDPQNCLAKKVLIDIIKNSDNELAKLLSIVALEKFQPNMKISFETLKNLILYSSDNKIRKRAIFNIKNFQYSQYLSANSIDEIITKSQTQKEKFQIYIIAADLGIIYPEATQLLEIIRFFNQYDDYKLWFLKEEAFHLICQQKNIIDYTEIIESTIKHCLVSKNLDTAAKLTFILGQVSSKKQKAIKILESIITKTEGWTHVVSIEYLYKLDQNLKYVDFLINLIIDPNIDSRKYVFSVEYIFNIIKNSITKIELLQLLQMNNYIFECKRLMSHIEYENNFLGFYGRYQFLWNCAENLPYPDFYQAWHNPLTTPHPEVQDTTPVASTAFAQHGNLALLPQSINQAIQSSSHPLNRKIICIDGSRFSDTSNPTLQIYTTLKKAGCPPSPDSKPRTISELQAYCEDDLSAEKIALILYEEPTDPPPQGFDIAVLNQLARLSHPPIAVVVREALAECQLPQFLERDPNLIANILQWLHNLER